MTEQQLMELLELNPDGVALQYEVKADSSGQVISRAVRCSVNVRNAAGLKNGIFGYCDEYAKGGEV